MNYTGKMLVALAVSCMAPIAEAASIMQTYTGPLPVTITGTLPDQGTALEQTFTLPSDGSPFNLTIFTTSYEDGGFQPNLFLFDDMGDFISAGIPAGSPDPTTGLVGDTRLMVSNLPSGTYIVAITDFLLNQSLTAMGLEDGFTLNYGDGTTFVDANGNTRTGDFSLTIQAAPIPEPSTLWLAGPIVAWLGLRARKRGPQQNIDSRS